MAVAKLKISMADGNLAPTSIGGKVDSATAAGAVDTFVTALAPICHPFSVLGAGLTSPLDVTTIEGDSAGENERSKKWAIVAQNSMGFKETHYAPCADFSVVPTGSDILPIDAGVGQTFAAAFESLFVDANGGALTVLKIFKARS